ncbi:MAG: patatin-like phospholipase family protein [Phycisphaerales bacterium]|nr:patatin-like phospholipase family protein [Phycisphaerales bacterium]
MQPFSISTILTQLRQHELKIALIAIALGLCGCTTVNQPLNSANLAMENRSLNETRAAVDAEVPPQQVRTTAFTPRQRTQWQETWFADEAPQLDQDGLFVGLALSGGGSRSANFAAACMFQLQRLGILQKVDYISAVSGGTLPAAYYCTHGKEWNPQNVQRVLTKDFATEVIVDTFVPWNLMALTFSDYDRGDLLASSFQRSLFSGKGRGLTFGDLRPDRPRLLINATNLQTGKRFVFSNETFDQLNSDLSNYPIAYACAASSAVPVLIHHVTLRDYSTIYKQFVHLVDGGIDDNLGIRTLIETYEAQQESARRQNLPQPYPRGAVFIVIDAKTNYDADLSDKGDIGLIDAIARGAGLASTVLLERASTATMADIIVQYSPNNVTADELRQQIDLLENKGFLQLHDRAGNQVQVLHLALTRVSQLTDQPFASFGSAVNNIQTYYNITQTAAYHLYLAAELLCTRLFPDELDQLAGQINANPMPAPSSSP